MNTNFTEALLDLKKAKSVQEWNQTREKWAFIITSQELANIDSKGFIVEVLGKDLDASLN